MPLSVFEMKMSDRFPLFCVLLHAFQATGQIQFISPYGGKNITAFVGDSVQFTWRYSGGARGISGVTWGLKQDSQQDVDPNGVLVSVSTKSGQGQLPDTLPLRYSGRVSWTFRGNQSSGQVDFTLMSLENDDDRFYACKLYGDGDFDSPQFDPVYLVIQGPPSITYISPNTTVKEGDTVILNCSARGNPPANITWTKDKRVANFPLRNISREAAGSYRCTAVSGVGRPATADVFITVQYKPTIKSVSPPLVTNSWIGERVSLQCEADGVPLPNITWKKPDESPIKSVQAAKNTIEVLMQSDTDFGNYTCEAANDVGADTRKVYVKQLKAPGSPNISVTTEATSLTVTWLPPIYDGGSTVTGYLVQVINSTHGILIRNFTTPHSARKLEIPNLKKDTDYMVRVIARNKVSLGTAAEILAKTKFVGPPTAVTTKCQIQDDNVSISITWKQPASNGADITLYKVYQRRRNEEEWMEIRTIKNTSSLGFVVKELEKGKEYDFLITARNTHGESVKKGYCKRVQVPGDVPGAVNTTCSTKKDKVILTWKQPASNGAAIKGYKVYQKGGNKEQWTEIEQINNASREYIVSEVEKGEEYDFVVTATNDYGDSPKMRGCKGVRLPEDSLPTTKAQTGGINTVVVAGAAAAGVLLIMGVVVFGIWWKRRKSSRDDPSSSAAALRSDNHHEPDDGYQDVSASAAARGLQAEAGPMAEPDYAQVDVSKKRRNRRPVTDEYAQVDRSKKSKKPRKQPGELDYAELDDFRPSVQPVAAAAEAAPARPLIRRPAYEGTEYADITQFGVPQPEPTYGNVPKKDVVYSNVQGGR